MLYRKSYSAYSHHPGSFNEILIGDCCEVAGVKVLGILQQVGAAAISFLKLCNIADRVTGLQLYNLSPCIVQCRALSHYCDHTRSHLPDGNYGSRMTGLGVYQNINVAASHGVITASLGTCQELTEEQYSMEATVCYCCIGLRKAHIWGPKAQPAVGYGL
ncbi:hypothetical protein PITC_059490 [Penicillium italicum]|uniref:Uncharacterized protein n=1 Tax=Penicillium italicum TaxID=40296 RepID=A0A0A2LGJ9_PENIT|nr:hypothetical protein PITC_059490 [Penicillium italicum]